MKISVFLSLEIMNVFNYNMNDIRKLTDNENYVWHMSLLVKLHYIRTLPIHCVDW